MANENQYTGRGDAFLGFSGNAVDFGSEAALDRVVKMVITNNNAADQLVIFNPSIAPSTPARVIKDGVIAYGVGAVDLVAAGEPNTIAEALAYIAKYPTDIISVRVTTNNALQFDQVITLTKRELGQAPVVKRLNLQNYVSQFANNDKIITVTEEFILSDLIEGSIIIPALTKTTLSFKFGVSLNTHTALETKKAIALTSPAVAQQRAAMATK